MSRSTEPGLWLPLGSALVIDWKHLGRPASARGATVWVAHLDDEPVLLRAWGEETTSYFDFAFLSDERVAGGIVIGCSRTEVGRLRVKVAVDVEGYLSYVDTCDYKEHTRTMLLTPSNRALETKTGTPPAAGPPRLTAACAEIFEIAPDGALVTACGAWIASVLRMARDLVQGRETAVSESAAAAPANHANAAPALSAPPVPAAAPAPAAGPARSRTEHMGVRPPARETLDGSSRKTPAVERREAAEPPPPRAARQKDGAPPAKITCTTNGGEKFEIASDETYIGRSKQCAIVLKSQRVSRKHACVTREADGFYINDLGAANGIWQGSEKIDREKIRTGDEYIVGDVVLSFSFA